MIRCDCPRRIPFPVPPRMTASRLDREERAQAAELEDVGSNVLFEVIRRDGAHELDRRFAPLFWSGTMAGLAISTSVLAKGYLTAFLPDAAWTPLISNFGYTLGFLIVIMGRMQLFTENTITPVLQLFYAFNAEQLRKTLRLWGIVFGANMLGCLVAAALIAFARIVPPLQMDGVMAVAHHYAEATAMEHFTWGMPAGFLIAALVWMLPRMEGAGEVLTIIILTYVIGLGGMSHVVAGAVELFLLMLVGDLTAAQTIGGGVLPALLGNVIGGTGMFALLAYAQVRQEV